MVKFLKTFFRSKRDLEVALEISIGKRSKLERDLELTERRLKSAQILHKTLLKANNVQSDAIASLQRDLAAAHAQLLIQEETPPETLHGAGNHQRKKQRKKHVRLNTEQRAALVHSRCYGAKIAVLAVLFNVAERTVHRIVNEAHRRDL